jgi:hypothetical protein
LPISSSKAKKYLSREPITVVRVLAFIKNNLLNKIRKGLWLRRLNKDFI